MDTRKSNIIIQDERRCDECDKLIPQSGFTFYFGKDGRNIEVCGECYYKAHPGVPYDERFVK